ncbi:hypothetical protein [Marinobacter alkaliphilus]|uniref:hypothetical protein n=1 Tax=Marinobacter alkaliphilus TaxID=254719 RepID=UPI003D766A6E
MAGDTKAFTIPAGGTYPINGNGETYIFCQFADRPIKVKIAGKTVTMRAGGYQEFEPLTGPNARVEFENTDPDNPAAVIFILGTGTYDEKIIRGEVSITPVLKNADGTTKTDTRYTLEVDLVPTKLTTVTYQADDVIDSVDLRPLVEADGEFFQGVYDGHVFKVGENIAVAVTNNAANDGEVLIFGKNMNLITTVNLALDYQRTDSAWHPKLGYLTVRDDANTEIKKANSDQSFTTIFTADYTITSFCWVEKTNNFLLYYERQGLVEEYNDGFGLVRSFSVVPVTGENSCIRYNKDRDSIWFKYGNVSSLQELDYDSLAEITNREFPDLPNIKSFCPVNNLLFAATESLAPNGYQARTLYKQALVDFSTKPVFKAVRAGCGVVDGLYVSQGTAQVFAALEVTELQTGIKVSGELVRAALEWYFRRKMGNQYLDHVYAVDFSRDENGLNFKPVSTGNETFKRANVADDFATLLPGRVVITIDNELPVEGAL